ncbi:MAG: hypothetical protein IIY84_04135 [Eubacterium sp.]|nr:hypothetical protein [Eubacterium sp.]
MRRRRALRRMMAVMLSVLMVLMTAVPAFAEDVYTTIIDQFEDLSAEGVANGPNILVMAYCDNPACQVFPEADDLTVVISHEGMEDIAVPVEKVQTEGDGLYMWIGASRVEQEILNRLAELQQKTIGEDPFGTLFGELEETEEQSAGEGDEAAPAGDGETAEGREEELEELYNLLSGYTFTLEGEHADHYRIVEGDTESFLLTSEIFDAAVDAIRSMYEELTEETFESFGAIVQRMLEFAGDYMSEEELATMQKLADNLDPLVEFLRSSDFGGILIVDITLGCDCPARTFYRIVHQYYRLKDGELTFVGSEDEFYEDLYGPFDEEEYIDEDPAGEEEPAEDDEEWPDEEWPEEDEEEWEDPWDYDDRFGFPAAGRGLVGETVYAADHIDPEFKGETYEYVGSYDLAQTLTWETEVDEESGEEYSYYEDAYMSEPGQWDPYAADLIVLEDYWELESDQGLVLVYVLEEETAEPVPAETQTKGESAPPEEPIREPAPNTGDHSGAGLWLALLLSAAGCAGALALRKKRG